MHHIKYAILSLLILALCANAHADYSTQFIRYAVEDDLSRIVISWEQVRGVRGVDHTVSYTHLTLPTKRIV